MNTDTRRALVASDSPIARDPRVLRQVRWLSELGFTVDTIGRGPRAPEAAGTHFAMRRPSALVRVLAYLLLPNRQKYRAIIESGIPAHVVSPSGDGVYDVVVLNEIELLPWFIARKSSLVAANGHTHLDLHEFAPSQRTGLAHRLVFKRYRDWLISHIPSPAFDSRSTVASGIARLYAERFGLDLPGIIRSCPDYVEQVPQPVDGNHIRLVHHGVASLSRGLEILINAMAEVDDRFSLELMLVGAPHDLAALRRLAEPLGSRVTFRDPVDVRSIASAINQYDAEVIFFPPVTENLRYALPNKFFEAVQGRLAIVTGNSSEMVEILTHYGNGVVASGWLASDLAAAVNTLSAESLTAMKQGSNVAARELTSEQEKTRFAEMISHAGAA